MSALDFTRPAFYPGDPILGLMALFAADPRTDKVNLGVGVYLDEEGSLPLPRAVAQAESRALARTRGRGYLPIGGLPALVREVKSLVVPEVEPERVASVQTLGGSGACKVAADFLRVELGATKVLVSDPSWANHQAIFAGAGLEVASYRYLSEGGVDVDAMLADLAAAEPGTVVVLHACCHNPTGFDLDAEQWTRVAEVCGERGLTPFVDMAYQGFADGLEADRLAVDTFVRAGQRVLVANSFSKNMGLYAERVGALSVVCADGDEALRVGSQLCRIVRTNYSSPPLTGGLLAAEVLGDAELRADWEAEVAEMRERIKAMRRALRSELEALGQTGVDFVTEQRGMFSFTGLGAEHMLALREQHGVYGTTDGRICVAGLNAGNLGQVARAIAAVR